MNKRTRNLLILAGALLCICGVIVVENAVTRHVDTISTIDEIVLQTDVDALTEVSWTKDDASLTFLRTEEGWKNSEDEAFPVNQMTLAGLLDHLKEVHACFVIEDVEDFGQYGLDEPQGTITLKTADSETTVSLGAYSTMDSNRYISIGDGKVYLIEDDLLDALSTERDDFMQHSEIPSISSVEQLTVSGNTTLNAVHDEDGVYTYTDAYHYYDVQNGVYEPLKDALVSSYTSNLLGLELRDYVTYNATAEDLETYALNEPAYTITLSGTDSDENAVFFTLDVGTVETPAEDEDSEPTTTAYARLNGSSIIYLLSAEQYQAVSACSFDELRPPEVFSLDWDIVTKITGKVDGTEICIEKGFPEKEEEDSDESSDEDAEPVFVLNGKEASVLSLKNAVNSLEITKYTEEKHGSSLELSLTIVQDNEVTPTLDLSVYTCDGSECLVVLNGTTLGRISRSQMVDLREALICLDLNNA